jgi:hypothetical protein
VPATHALSEHHQQTYKYLSVRDTCYCIPPLACQPTKSAQIQGGMRTAVRMKSLSGAGKLLRGFCVALPPAPTKPACSVSITASKQPGEMLRSLEPVPPRASAYAAACAASYSAEDSQSSTSEVCDLPLDSSILPIGTARVPTRDGKPHSLRSPSIGALCLARGCRITLLH